MKQTVEQIEDVMEKWEDGLLPRDEAYVAAVFILMEYFMIRLNVTIQK
jgi:hypothetical protein